MLSGICIRHIHQIKGRNSRALFVTQIEIDNGVTTSRWTRHTRGRQGYSGNSTNEPVVNACEAANPDNQYCLLEII